MTALATVNGQLRQSGITAHHDLDRPGTRLFLDNRTHDPVLWFDDIPTAERAEHLLCSCGYAVRRETRTYGVFLYLGEEA